MKRRLCFIFTFLFVNLSTTIYADIPKKNEIFYEQIKQFIYDGTKICSILEVGVSYSDVSEQLSEALTSYELALETWPDELPKESQELFSKAFKGWALMLELWDTKINDYRYPAELEDGTFLDNFDQYIEYAEAKLDIRTDKQTCSQGYYPGDEPSIKKCLPTWNISEIAIIANSYFKEGKTIAFKMIADS